MVRKSKRSNKTSGSSRRQGMGRVVTVETPSSAFERRLAQSADIVTLRGKLFQSASVTAGSVSLGLVFHPANFGGRSSNLATIFSRFRFLSVAMRFLSNVNGATQSSTVMAGVLDDASGTEGDAPTSPAGVLEQRCSALVLQNQTVPVDFIWRPVDRNLWYATTTGSSTSDPRLVFPGVLYYGNANAASAATVQVELDWEISFKGATDVGLL
jgi:hypothetical protein